MWKLEILKRWPLSWCDVLCSLRATVVDLRMEELYEMMGTEGCQFGCG